MGCTIKYPYSYNFDFVAIRMFLFITFNNVIKIVTENVTSNVTREINKLKYS
ncbi:hypothetical protein UT300005_13870 [Clostridium sp. CTA-5]